MDFHFLGLYFSSFPWTFGSIPVNIKVKRQYCYAAVNYTLISPVFPSIPSSIPGYSTAFSCSISLISSSLWILAFSMTLKPNNIAYTFCTCLMTVFWCWGYGFLGRIPEVKCPSHHLLLWGMWHHCRQWHCSVKAVYARFLLFSSSFSILFFSRPSLNLAHSKLKGIWRSTSWKVNNLHGVSGFSNKHDLHPIGVKKNQSIFN